MTFTLIMLLIYYHTPLVTSDAAVAIYARRRAGSSSFAER